MILMALFVYLERLSDIFFNLDPQQRSEAAKIVWWVRFGSREVRGLG
jgi:glutathione S-transferase